MTHSLQTLFLVCVVPFVVACGDDGPVNPVPAKDSGASVTPDASVATADAGADPADSGH